MSQHIQNRSVFRKRRWRVEFQTDRAMVISEQHISKNAEKVLKIPTLPFSNPNPAAAEKFPRSMIPEGMKTSG